MNLEIVDGDIIKVKPCTQELKTLSGYTDNEIRHFWLRKIADT
jgi:hypothetical protein